MHDATTAAMRGFLVVTHNVDPTAVVVVIEWTQAEAADLARLRAMAQASGFGVDADRGGLYRLICARENH